MYGMYRQINCATGAGEKSMPLRHVWHGPSAKASKRAREDDIPRNVAPDFKKIPERSDLFSPPPVYWTWRVSTLMKDVAPAAGNAM